MYCPLDDRISRQESRKSGKHWSRKYGVVRWPQPWLDRRQQQSNLPQRLTASVTYTCDNGAQWQYDHIGIDIQLGLIKMSGVKGSIHQHDIRMPEWEHQNAARFSHGQQHSRNRLDSWLPPHRRYLGLRRKWFLVACFAALLALLALIIGLSVGLTRHSRYVVLLALRRCLRVDTL